MYNKLPLNLHRTSAVGVYTAGASVEGVEDLVGNLWEWCLNEYDNPENTSLEGDKARALRGGSWMEFDGNCRCSVRDHDDPDLRDFDVSIRVSCLSPII